MSLVVNDINEARRDKHETRTYYLIVFSVFVSVFINSYVFFTEPFEFYIGYVIFVMLLPVFFFRHAMEPFLLRVFVLLLVVGIFNIFLENNTSALFFKVYTGLAMSYFFYYYIIVEFDFDIEQIFKWYLTGSYWVSWIGIVQFIFFMIGYENGYNFWYILNKWGYTPGGLFGIRINSVFAEPTHLGTVLSGAFFVAVYNLLRKETYHYNRFQGMIVIGVYFLSFSAMGQLGVFLAVFLLAISYGLVRYVLVAIPVSVFLFNIVYENVTDFRERYDSTVSLFSGGKFELGKTHGSSFTLYNNYVVAIKNFQDNYLFGSGIGSHPVAFQKYSLGKGIKTIGFNNNSADANSMLLRLISETGLFGTIIFLYITFRCYVVRGKEPETNHWLISNAILVMILLNLFRQGHYFLNGFPLFFLLYFYNHKSYQIYLETGKDLHQTMVSEAESDASQND